MPCIEEPATRTYLGPVEYTPHNDNDDDDDIYLLHLVFHPVALVGWRLQK